MSSSVVRTYWPMGQSERERNSPQSSHGSRVYLFSPLSSRVPTLPLFLSNVTKRSLIIAVLSSLIRCLQLRQLAVKSGLFVICHQVPIGPQGKGGQTSLLWSKVVKAHPAWSLASFTRQPSSLPPPPPRRRPLLHLLLFTVSFYSHNLSTCIYLCLFAYLSI